MSDELEWYDELMEALRLIHPHLRGDRQPIAKAYEVRAFGRLCSQVRRFDGGVAHGQLLGHDHVASASDTR